jgi:hypothetical protein
MDGIAEFLRARYDERKLMLLTVSPARLAWATFRHADGSMRYTSAASSNGDVWVCDGRVVEPDSVQVVFDRDQELADIAAKRRTIDLVLDEDNGVISADRSIESEWGCTSDLHEQLLSLLALPYAGHSDYREDWKP